MINLSFISEPWETISHFTVTTKRIVSMADTMKGICVVMGLIIFVMAKTLSNEQVNKRVI